MQIAMADSSGFVPPSFRLLLTDGPCSGQELSSTSGKGGFALTVGRTRVSKLYIRDTAVSEKHAVVGTSVAGNPTWAPCCARHHSAAFTGND